MLMNMENRIELHNYLGLVGLHLIGKLEDDDGRGVIED